MYRGRNAQDTFASSFELASALHTAWHLADAALRTEIEQVIRVYTRREPALREQLRIALACYKQTPLHRPDTRIVVATALHAVWQLGDPPLRAEIEQVIQRYVRQSPERLGDFKQIIARLESAKPPPNKRIDPRGMS